MINFDISFISLTLRSEQRKTKIRIPMTELVTTKYRRLIVRLVSKIVLSISRTGPQTETAINKEAINNLISLLINLAKFNLCIFWENLAKRLMDWIRLEIETPIAKLIMARLVNLTKIKVMVRLTIRE